MFFAENFADKFRRANFASEISLANSPANFDGKFRQTNFAGKFRQANFASEIFRRRTSQNVLWLSLLLLSFGLSCLRTGMVCVGARAMRPYGKADGAGLYLGPRRVTATKQSGLAMNS